MICEICKKDFKSKNALAIHISKSHNILLKEYYDTYMKQENDEICPTCGKELVYIGGLKGYKKHCNAKCAQNDPFVRQKIKQTNLIKFGVDIPAKSTEVVNKMKQTNLTKYGKSSYLATTECRTHLQEVNQQLYGKNTPFESEKVQKKVKQTNNKNLGVDYPLSNKSIHEKAQNAKLAYIAEYATVNHYIPLVELTNAYGWGWLYELDIPYIVYKHVALVEQKYLDDIIKYAKEHPIIPKISKHNGYHSGGHIKSKLEDEIVQYIQNIYTGKIITNTRQVIQPYELDIYLPDEQFAIEVNGIYWHSIKHKPKSYHQKKALLCKDFGIRLMHIYEFEPITRIKQYIFNALTHNEQIDITKPCDLDKDNWKLYEQLGANQAKITAPTKLLDFPELYNSGSIVYKLLR